MWTMNRSPGHGAHIAGRAARSEAPLARIVRLTAAVVAVVGLSACEDFRYPRDPDNTLEQVLATKRMRVAAVDHVPWVIVNNSGAPTGAEVDLVEAFAREIGATIDWRRMPAFEALEALKRGEVDLAIGGFTQKAVTAHKSAAHTYAYFSEALIVAAEPGAPIPQDLEGLKVYAAPDLMVDGFIRDEDGIPVSDKSDEVRLVALPHWKLPKGNLAATGIVLNREKRVMAVPRGENAWVMRLERFLRTHAGEVDARLREHAP